MQLKSACFAPADGSQPLVTSMSADAMHLQQEDAMDIVKICSGPQGCSAGVILQCIAKGGLQVMLRVPVC